mmetsp:Transcript_17881/g.36066  ORF Transcript_17881/g.36066 Transcript_17881/m.36066 type:complete len:201 (-) Transcript_17881:137-739(-)
MQEACHAGVVLLLPPLIRAHHQHGLAPYLETPPLLALLHHGPLLRSSNSFACSSSGNASIAARSRTTVLSSANTAPSVHAPTAAAASNRNIADNATQTPPSCTLRSPPPARTVKAMGAMMGMVPSCRGRIGTSITPASTCVGQSGPPTMSDTLSNDRRPGFCMITFIAFTVGLLTTRRDLIQTECLRSRPIAKYCIRQLT